MLSKFKQILLLGFVFALLMGCTVEDRPENILPEFTTSPTIMPTPTRTHLPSMTAPPTGRPDTRPTWTPKPFIPSATSEPTATISTPTAVPVIEEIFVREGIPVPQPEEVISVENANQLVELARWGYGAINQVSHTRDGRLMLVQTDVGIYAYQVGTLNEVWRFIPGEKVDTLSLDENGRVMVQVEGKTIFLLDSDEGGVVDSYQGELSEIDAPLPGEPLDVANSRVDQTVVDAFFDQVNVPEGLGFWGVSPGGNYFVFAGEMNTVAVYRVSDFSLVLMFDPENSLSMMVPHLAKLDQRSGLGLDYIYSIVFNRSESYLMAANGRGQIYFFDLERGELNIAVHGNGGKLIIPPYGDYVIYYDEDTLEVYAIPSGEREAGLNFSADFPKKMFFSPGGTLLALGVTLWNVEDGTFRTMPENEKVIGFSQNGNYVYSIREEWWWVKRRTTDLVLNEQVYLQIEHEDPYYEEEMRLLIGFNTFWSYSQEDNHVTAYITTNNNPTWSTLTGEMLEIPEDDLDPRNKLSSAVSPDGAMRAEISDKGVELTDNATGEALDTLDVSMWGAVNLAFSPDGRYLATAADNGVIRLWGVPLFQGE